VADKVVAVDRSVYGLGLANLIITTYPRPPASTRSIECSQYALMPSQKVSVVIVWLDPRGGKLEKVIEPDATGVAGNALTIAEVMMP
jgi:hypothetical protein